MRQSKYILAACLLLSASACDHKSESPKSEPTKSEALFDLIDTPVGDVAFSVGCEREAAKLVERGVALTHHMMYESARFVFGMADNADPECALAYWGQAMTIINPLWPNTPTDDQLAQGEQLVEKALAIGGHDERETAYLGTMAAYFIGGAERSEAQRLLRLESAWKSVAADYPDDIDAQAFSLLAALATTDPDDRALQKQRAVGEAALALLEIAPNHPGAHHYLIHAYDYPELARKALPVANHYGEITPRVPHATHMMTHIYTRLGMWDEAIEWNNVSAEVALAICLETGNVNNHYTHALDYLAYAHLQKAEDRKVLDIMETTDALQPPYSGNLHASAYALAAVPARYALERRDWEAARRLTPRSPATFPWDAQHEPYVAITHFVKAIGAARLGDLELADREIEALAGLRESVAQRNQYWAKQLSVQIETAKAWRVFAGGDVASALDLMREAAALEASTEKHPVTPGEIAPAAELLGDMFFEAGRYQDALQSYEKALTRSPNRYNSLLGGARSAEAMEDHAVARTYYSALVAIAGDGERPSLQDATLFLNQTG